MRERTSARSRVARRSCVGVLAPALAALCVGAAPPGRTAGASAATLPTFGKTSVGASAGEFAADRKRVSKYTLPVAATVGELRVYLAPTGRSGQQVLKGVVYADSGGAPGRLLGTSKQLTFTSTSSARWYHLTFPAPLQLPAGDYWLGEITGASADVAGYRYDTVAGARDWNTNTYTSGPSDPFGSYTNDSEQISLYATYTPQEEKTEEEPPPGDGTGQVRLVKDANSSFDEEDIEANSAWINEHFYRMTAYSPWFDRNLGWYHRARVYDDAYAIYKGSSLASEHPGWIVRDASGNKLYIPYHCANGSCPQYAADISNREWRSHYISTLKATLAKGYIGVFVDDVDMWANTSNGSGQLVAPIDHNTGKPMTDEVWRGYFVTFMEELRAAIPGYEITQNQVWFVAGGPAANAQIAQSMRQADCVNIEFGVDDKGLSGGTGSLSVNSLLNYVDAVHSLGTAIDMGGNGTSARLLQYTLAGYFLVNDGSDLVSANNSQRVTKFWQGWSVNLGAAEGPRTRSSEGLFERKFTRGLVYLNEPGATSKTIVLPSPMKNVAGKTVSSITLAAASGAVLRK